MAEKMATIYIDEYLRRCEESKVSQVLENIENLKREYRKKGVPQETLDEMYSVRIVKDEDGREQMCSGCDTADMKPITF